MINRLANKSSVLAEMGHRGHNRGRSENRSADHRRPLQTTADYRRPLQTAPQTTAGRTADRECNPGTRAPENPGKPADYQTRKPGFVCGQKPGFPGLTILITTKIIKFLNSLL